MPGAWTGRPVGTEGSLHYHPCQFSSPWRYCGKERLSVSSVTGTGINWEHTAGTLHLHHSPDAHLHQPSPSSTVTSILLSCPVPDSQEGTLCPGATHQLQHLLLSLQCGHQLLTITHSIVLSSVPANKAINYSLSLSRCWLEQQSMCNPSLPALREQRQMP